ncbi:hypothetical protein [Dysgonomonas macrotermitis]|nr:hypothetical protein [Dysgonomonas macrotermitis]
MIEKNTFLPTGIFSYRIACIRLETIIKNCLKAFNRHSKNSIIHLYGINEDIAIAPQAYMASG